jgi:adenine specific DNA methylase Mod
MAINNYLFYGDNLEVLRKSVKDESVDLCYIDPPFNSQRNYNQIYNNIGTEDIALAQAFTDTWIWDSIAISGYEEVIENPIGRFTSQTVELIKGLRQVLGEGSLLAYVVSLTLRVNEIQRVLKKKGSFYLHCDPTASHYIKLVLDGIFCSRGGDFKNEIIWKRTTAHSDTKQGLKRYGKIHDVMFFYTKNRKPKFNTQYVPYDQSYIESHYRNIEPGTSLATNRAVTQNFCGASSVVRATAHVGRQILTTSIRTPNRVLSTKRSHLTRIVTGHIQETISSNMQIKDA